MRLSGYQAAIHCGLPRARRSVREVLIDLQYVAVRVTEFGYQQTNVALPPVARILRRLELTGDLYAGRVFNGRPVGVGVNGSLDLQK